jgi:hypothetical protein
MTADTAIIVRVAVVRCDHLWMLSPLLTSDGSPWGVECLGCKREFWTDEDFRELFGQ